MEHFLHNLIPPEDLDNNLEVELEENEEEEEFEEEKDEDDDLEEGGLGVALVGFEGLETEVYFLLG